MKIYDISLPISRDIPIWPGDPGVSVEPWLRISKGDPANVSLLSFGSHTGTHIDPPYHFKEDGITVDLIPLTLLWGKARVFELGVEEKINRADLEGQDWHRVKRALFKTANSLLWEKRDFCKAFIYLTPDAAEFLAEREIKLIGIDYLSIEGFHQEGHLTHHILLGKGIVIIEGLDLREVPPGDYEMVALPLKILKGDGAPARVILREISHEDASRLL